MTDAEIETRARSICKKRNLDPDAMVRAKEADQWTDFERAEFEGGAGSSFVDGLIYEVPQWRKYRAEAARL